MRNHWLSVGKGKREAQWLSLGFLVPLFTLALFTILFWGDSLGKLRYRVPQSQELGSSFKVP